uniref:Uncharacterized protein n=1 Tax=Kalanchoe fedtschenkoi TaxID=63787 RepID=A0A7N0VKQ6_KALFE
MCLSTMHNPEQHKAALMSPRISFSNDFVESQQLRKSSREKIQEAPPVSSDFEFSVASDSMMSANELFCKGKLLPFKQSQLQKAATTLRDELLHDDEDNGGNMTGCSRPPKSSATKRNGILGLNKRTHTTDMTTESRRPSLSLDKFVKTSKSLKGDFNAGASNCDDMDIDS